MSQLEAMILQKAVELASTSVNVSKGSLVYTELFYSKAEQAEVANCRAFVREEIDSFKAKARAANHKITFSEWAKLVNIIGTKVAIKFLTTRICPEQCEASSLEWECSEYD